MSRGRPPKPPATALGVALRRQRGTRTGDEIAEELRFERGTYYGFERGVVPGFKASEKLAMWLGWSVGAVIDAARRPAE